MERRKDYSIHGMLAEGQEAILKDFHGFNRKFIHGRYTQVLDEIEKLLCASVNRSPFKGCKENFPSSS
jgi:hypothetical protein